MAVDLSVTDNPLSIPEQVLFEMAARVNKKRGFLFVSKVLGKHIPVHPLKPLLASGLLALEYAERKTGRELKEKADILNGFLSGTDSGLRNAYRTLQKQRVALEGAPLVIGFAETATALGHAVYDCIENASYVHTTREQIRNNEPSITFVEEHSHATDQLCYAEPHMINNNCPVILVDDEITTGKTALHIIRDIQSKFPRKEYAVLSLLDWRTEEHKQAYAEAERELGVTISTTALLSGRISFKGELLSESTYDYKPKPQESAINRTDIDLSGFFATLPYQPATFADEHFYVKETGRFGLKASDRQAVHEACRLAAQHVEQYRKGRRTLVLGTGELMYIPMNIAAHLHGSISYHSTTRSPIHPVAKEGYAVQNGYSFMNPEDEEVRHFIYNLPAGAYDEVFFCLEKTVSDEALQPIFHIFKEKEVPHIHIVTLSGKA
ncbi:phosphoribosyltransferase family protein [Bacillus mojavensis]|uniref:phosphoribosyltransferase family protein n=1 Tax=Bacillus mojavensis TaxID=72360 RepID=UPI002DBB3478|nr:phosphoribosyltransferase family protein [Bacillus mojavensis]MEC1754508.1 phosphoribosyltransferase family protein [Bacillus mojavensis]